MTAAALEFATTDARVSDVRLYTGKSMEATTAQGVAPRALEVSPAGFVLNGVPDRWAVAGAVLDEGSRTANMISQRGWSPGSQSIDFPGDSMLATVSTDVIAKGKLQVNIPGEKPFIVETDDANYGDLWNVRIHNSTYVAADLGEIAASRLTDFLHRSNPNAPRREVRLFGARLDGLNDRKVRDEYRQHGASDRVNGADGAALLAVNEDTLLAMQEEFGIDDEWVSIMRSRANVVISGLGPYSERFIKAVRIGKLVLANVGPCSRCVETGVEQTTGLRDDNRFLRILGKAGQAGWSAATGGRGLFFGFNLQPVLERDQTATVSIGDNIEVAWSEEPDVLKVKPAGE